MVVHTPRGKVFKLPSDGQEEPVRQVVGEKYVRGYRLKPGAILNKDLIEKIQVMGIPLDALYIKDIDQGISRIALNRRAATVRRRTIDESTMKPITKEKGRLDEGTLVVQLGLPTAYKPAVRFVATDADNPDPSPLLRFDVLPRAEEVVIVTSEELPMESQRNFLRRETNRNRSLPQSSLAWEYHITMPQTIVYNTPQRGNKVAE